MVNRGTNARRVVVTLRTHTRGKLASMKAMAVLLYAKGNMGYGMTGRLLGVSHVSVYRWIRAEADKIEEPSPQPDPDIVQLDGMWHFVGGKKQNLDLAGD